MASLPPSDKDTAPGSHHANQAMLGRTVSLHYRSVVGWDTDLDPSISEQNTRNFQKVNWGKIPKRPVPKLPEKAAEQQEVTSRMRQDLETADSFVIENDHWDVIGITI